LWREHVLRPEENGSHWESHFVGRLWLWSAGIWHRIVSVNMHWSFGGACCIVLDVSQTREQGTPVLHVCYRKHNRILPIPTRGLHQTIS
jgi:hypothetical protein